MPVRVSNGSSTYGRNGSKVEVQVLDHTVL
jgi:hypothetical protein